jgi:hypothetical protein
MADAEVKVTEPVNEVTMEARRLASVRVIDQQVEGFQSKRRAAAPQVDGRTKESKRGHEGCQGDVKISLDPTLYDDDRTPQATLAAECKAHSLPYSKKTKHQMANVLKKHHEKYHTNKARRKNNRTEMADYFAAVAKAAN